MNFQKYLYSFIIPSYNKIESKNRPRKKVDLCSAVFYGKEDHSDAHFTFRC